MSIRKEFDPSLYADNNSRAIAAVLHHLHESGIYATENPDKYGPDIIIYRKYKPVSYVEVEVKLVWKSNQEQFPFPSVQLPERKKKFMQLGLPCEFWILREDVQYAVSIPDSVLGDERLVEVPNRLVSNGEYFYQIPVEECSLVELLKSDR